MKSLIVQVQKPHQVIAFTDEIEKTITESGLSSSVCHLFASMGNKMLFMNMAKSYDF